MPLTDLRKILNARMHFPRLSPVFGNDTSARAIYLRGLLAFHPLIFNVHGGLAAFENVDQGPQIHSKKIFAQGLFAGLLASMVGYWFTLL